MCHCKREGIKHKYTIAQTVIKSGIIIFIHINDIKSLAKEDKNLFKITFFEAA